MPNAERRIATKRAARAISMPEATLRLWLRAERQEATAQGYPISTVLRVLESHGRSVARATLENATTGPRNRRAVASQPTSAGSEDAPDVAPAAVTVLAELLREERAARSQAEQAAAMWQERARNLEARVDALLALPEHVPESPPWWHRLLRRGR